MKKRLIKYDFIEMDLQSKISTYKLTYKYYLFFNLIKFNKTEVKEVDEYSYLPKYWETIINKPILERL